jgi:glycine/D-amino acid oxidase-like deaminating enzyme
MSFAAAAKRHGATVATGTPVEHVEPGAVVTSGGTVRSEAIVVCAGPWAPPLLAPLGYELPAVPARAQIGRFRVPTGADSTLPAIADLGPLQFYVKRGEGPFLEVGTLDPDHTVEPIDPDACPEGADPGTLAHFHRSLVQRVPDLAGGHWRGSWSGVYDVTPDWQPAIGPVPGAEGVYVAAGLSGHGFKLAPAIALALSGLVADGDWDRFDLSLFDPGRFARGELIDSRYGYSVVG